ncbi:XkdF-like putative serine protease domain-containing protein [Brevibacillus laterosporus]|uniref:XkdF-like putative serine protease domain-containing protein n=1 Tax=Brevibacillus laterosporus TaxID=1465 RepID=UPI0035A704B0
MSYQLKDAKITHISLVDKGANGRPFAIIKEEGKSPLEKTIPIAKADKAKQIVYGVVYEPDVNDAHGDQMTFEEIEKAAHGFMERQNTYNIDKQHDLDSDKGYVVESYIAPVDMKLGDQEIKKGSWIAGVKVIDTDTWDQIEKSEITGFSMWGIGKREKIEEAPSNTDETVTKGLFQSLAKSLSHIIKAGRKISADRADKLKRVHNTLTDILAEVDHKEEENVKTEAIEKAVSAALSPITNQLETLQTEVTELKKEASSSEEGSSQEDTLTQAIQKALEPISKQVESLSADVQIVKNSRGASQQGQEDPTQIQKSQNNGLFAGKL